MKRKKENQYITRQQYVTAISHFQCKESLYISGNHVVVACMPKNVVKTRFVGKLTLLGQKDKLLDTHVFKDLFQLSSDRGPDFSL